MTQWRLAFCVFCFNWLELVVQGWYILAETNNVFISWSGPRSKSAAEALKDWLPTILQTARPWMSATDIEKGTRWREEVTEALDTMKAGIICLTPENLTAEWLLFEAGALSEIRDHQTRVWTYLLADLKPQHVKDPLAMFQATTADKEDTRKLIHSINKILDATVADGRLNHLFDKLWPDLEQRLSALPSPPGAIPPKCSPDEIAADTLEIVRALAPLVQNIASEIEIARTQRRRDEQLRKAIARLHGETVLTTSSLPLSGSLSEMNTLVHFNPNFESTPPPQNEPEGTHDVPSANPRRPVSPRRKRPLASRRPEPKPSGSS
ncbi:MAG: toll/interleukin-1 receptor domain-containing protein [Candidatus Acidiferrum sp.]